MARKYDIISELYNRTCKMVSSSPQNWENFLSSACNNFRLRFDEQLLVFAQRPDATAVLEIERWNQSFGRWVNRGATGIAVFEDADRSRQRLIHYFDIADTHESRFSRPVPIWKMKPEYEEEVIETLESTFGEIENKSNLANAILCAARNATEDNIPDYAGDLHYTVRDSYLEELDEDTTVSIYKRLVSNSIAYMMMERLGIDTEEYFDRDDFQDVVNFNTPETLNALGFATSDIAEMGLAEIAKTVISLEKQNRIIAEKQGNNYNISRNNNTERSFENDRENDLHNAGRLQSARPDNARTTGGSDGTLRTDAKEVPEGTTQGSLLQPTDKLQDERAFERGSGTSDLNGGTLGEGNGGEGRLDGRTESDRYDEMGSLDEQSSQSSDGNRVEGSSLRLEHFDRKSYNSDIPYFANDDVIREMFATTPHLKASKDDIRAFFEVNRNEDERAEYLKEIFNNDITEITLSDGRTVGYKTYENVLHLFEGTYDNRTKECFDSWKSVVDYFNSMYLLGELYDTSKPLPSIDGQMTLILDAHAEEKSSAFSLPQEFIDAYLCKGSSFSESKMRIYEQFQKSLSHKENADFLKHEYGTGGSSSAIMGSGIGESHDAKGITLTRGWSRDNTLVKLNWNQVEKRIGELIKMDRYLNPKEKEKYPEWLAEREQERTRIEEEKRNREILSTAPPEAKAEPTVQPEITPEKQYEYHLGDTVYLGASEYQILSYDDDRVMLYDTEYPLFNKEVDRAEFDRKVRENPMNDHLIATVIVNHNTTSIGIEENIFNDPSREMFRAIYYNPDSLSEGQFVIMDFTYELVLEAAESTEDTENFFEYLAQNAYTELVDYGTEDFNSMLEVYADAHPDFIGRLEENKNFMIEEAKEQLSLTTPVMERKSDIYYDIFDHDREPSYSENPMNDHLIVTEKPITVFDREEEILYSVLNALKIDDIEIHKEENRLIASDATSVWFDKDFYEFLVKEAFVFEDNGEVAGIRNELLKEFTELSEHYGVTVKDNRYKPMYREYLAIKNENPDSIVFYQVGDFFECYNDDAQKAADIFDLFVTSRPVSDSERVPMFGIPKHAMERYMTMLTDRGNDVTISALEDGERKIYSLSSQNKEDPVESIPVGRIDYLHTDGSVRESLEYTSPYQFEKDIKEENQYGVPMSIFVYADKDGQTIPHTFIAELDPPPQGFSVIPSPYLEIETPIVEETEEEKIEAEPIVPTWEQPKKSRVQSFDLHPEIPMAERHSFDLANNEIPEVNKKERFHRNYMAIKVLKDCQNENRFATPEEQVMLSKYVGWGGIPEVFDERHSAWHTEYAMLKNILTDEEYASARESTLTAFYTPQTVIKSVYKAMEQLGFREGNILEPSCGIGHFIGMLPESMKEAKVYGVEIDTISAGIAQQLYQKSSIAAQGFEEANLPDSFFDAVVGNVPFGDFKVPDKRYDKHKFLIHDYFFAKSLDKLRPGGVMALITSKGTMDKENSAVRKYIAQRADLLGAIRLPNNTFKGNAGTEVVSDILILQKRDRIVDIEPDWVHLGTDENGITMNSYFVEHPEMILGEMKMVSGRFGPEPSCVPYEGADLESQLEEAIANIHGQITEFEIDEELTEEDNSIPADPTVRNFSYTLVDDKIYFRENSRMTPVEVSATAENRIKGMIGIRDSVRTLIELQTEDYPDSEIKAEQENLNRLYDNFTTKYGLINSRANSSAFSQDSSFSLLSALEVLGDDGQLERKADMFFKRTIKPHTPVTSVDTSSEALAVSMGEKACIDMDYMMELSGKSEEEIYSDLKGVIFLNPMYGYGNSTEQKYLMADEYLSGNVREKLAWARQSAELHPEDYTVNVEALERVQPKDLTASEIAVRLGTTWIPTEIVEQFMFEFLGTPRYNQWRMKVHFSEYTGEWNIENKSYDRGNVKAYSTYGTSRINAYKIMEETLNLKDVRIFDYIEDDEGKKKAVLNKKETAIAQSKQELIKQGFQDWIWKDPQRRERLTKMYNEKFNSIRPREYDGSHITFNGMNPEIELREHQRNAVAHILYGGNTLLAHAVGAGKTFEMTAAAMEAKRLGLCNKSLFVVPNHLTEQWAAEFLQLYPSANILVATKKDFEMKNRKRFCGRIATGDYDAIIIGHSQFEKIPMSIERQRAILEEQLEEVMMGIEDLKRNRGDNFSVKALERTKKSVKQKLDKLNDQTRKDDVVTFEELGVDRLFIDESHYYKNLFLYTKMRNVGGIAQTEAQKSSDLFMKCRYLDEITGGRGTVFATGTPISNSMVELYTIQRYLQYNTLVKNNLQHFDAWASTFGETITAVELTPEGTGYRAKTRFARFYNLPELMSMFKEVADIQTADMLDLPVPKANFHNVAVKPSEMQKEMVAELSERADKVRNGMVDASVDNMLKITNDGRKLALDQRLINDMLPDYEGSKLNACVDNIYRLWEEGKDKYSAQLFFCDLSTPKGDGTFSVYNDIRKKLIERGVPESEVRFIHEADTETKKLELFKKTRKGEVRLLMGSTQKMGAGTNVQNKLVALHDLDCPWRPSDLEQRLGRIVRQGNENTEVDIFRYVTEETFDAYLYQLVEGKQKFASQIMTSKSPVRSCEDIDETALSYAEIKMLATGNPYIKEKMDLDIQVQKLRLLKSNFLSEKYELEDKIIKFFPLDIASKTATIEGLKTDIECANRHPKPLDDTFIGMTVQGVSFSEKADAGNAILEACKSMKNPEPIPLGEYRGFNMELLFDTTSKEYKVKLKGELSYYVSLGTDTFGNITRLDNVIESLPKRLETCEQQLENTKQQFETAKVDVEKPFVHEEDLKTKTARLNELNALLNVDKKENEILGGEPDEGDETPTRNKERER